MEVKATTEGGKRLFIPLAALSMSWIVVAIAPWLARYVPWRSDYDPRVPNVAMIPWSPTTDVMSSVSGFFKVMVFAAVAWLTVEISKVALPPHSRKLYAALLVYQLVLAADAVRTHAPDWWVALAYWAGFTLSTSRTHGGATPWVSFAGFLAAAALLVWSARTGDGWHARGGPGSA